MSCRLKVADNMDRPTKTNTPDCHTKTHGAVEDDAVSSFKSALNQKYGLDMREPVSEQLEELILRLNRLKESGGRLIE